MSDEVLGGAGGEIALGAIPLVVAAEPAPAEQPKRRWRFGIPRIVDYLIVAIFMFFVL